MNNEKNLFLVLVAFISASVAMAQSGNAPKFYIKGYGGYGILTPGSYKGNSPQSDYENFATGNLGAGAGVHFGGGVGYVINDFLNVGVDAEYMNGKLHSSTSADNANTYSFFSQKIDYSLTSIIPNITFKALSRPNYYVYTRVGIIIAASTKIEFTNYDSSIEHGNGFVNITSGDEKYAFHIELGIQTAVGVQFGITERLRSFTELVANILPASPISSTQEYVNSNYFKTSTSTTTPNVTEFNYTYTYKKSGSYEPATSNGGYDITKNLPSITQNINYIGVNIGVAFRL
jgi:hypothetical protein